MNIVSLFKWRRKPMTEFRLRLIRDTERFLNRRLQAGARSLAACNRRPTEARSVANPGESSIWHTREEAT